MGASEASPYTLFSDMEIIFLVLDGFKSAVLTNVVVMEKF